MDKRLIELHQQRGRLIERIAMQRVTLARELAPVRATLDTTDRALAAVRDSVCYLRQHPAAVAALAAALFALKPRMLWRWLQRGFLVWRSWRALRGVLWSLQQRPPGNSGSSKQ
jgi:hypothetical protein